MKTLIPAVAAAALITLASGAQAQMRSAGGPQGWYVGAGAGQSNVSWDAGALAGTLSALGYFSGSVTTDRRDTAWRAFAGYRYGPHLAAEIGYTDYGSTGWNATVSRPAGTLASSADLTSIDLDALLFWPVLGLDPFVRVGVGQVTMKTALTATGAARASSGATDRSTRLRYGVGAQVSFGALGLRAEWTRIDSVGGDATGGKVDANLALASVLWRF